MKPKALIPECRVLVQDNDKPVHVKTKKMWRNELQDENTSFFLYIVSYKKNTDMYGCV